MIYFFAAIFSLQFCDTVEFQSKSNHFMTINNIFATCFLQKQRFPTFFAQVLHILKIEFFDAPLDMSRVPSEVRIPLVGNHWSFRNIWRIFPSIVYYNSYERITISNLIIKCFC